MEAVTALGWGGLPQDIPVPGTTTAIVRPMSVSIVMERG